MLLFDDFVHIVFLSALDVTAMFANVLFIFIIVRKTPKTLFTYSSILLSIACVDFVSSFSSLMSIASVQNDKGCVLISYLGPCTLMNAQLCHLFLALHANSIAQSVLLLLISFAYRFSTLKTTSLVQKHQQNKLRTVLQIMTLGFTVLNTIQMILGGSYEIIDSDQFRTISVLDLTGGITDNILPRLSIFSIFMTYLIGFSSIFIIRRRLFAGIGKLKHSDRQGHQLIYRSLTAQMLLPLAYMIGSSFWLLDVAGIVHSRTLQRSVLTLSSLFALVSPLINMNYIPPYRKYVQSLFSMSYQIAPREAEATSKF